MWATRGWIHSRRTESVPWTAMMTTTVRRRRRPRNHLFVPFSSSSSSSSTVPSGPPLGPHLTAAPKSSSSSQHSLYSWPMGPLLLSSLAMGFVLGRESVPPHPPPNDSLNHPHPHPHTHHLPDGMPRTCGCEPSKGTLTEQQEQELFDTLKRIVGKSHVLKGHEPPTSETLPFLTPARQIGGKDTLGQALFIVQPHTFKEVVEVVQAAVDAGCVLLVQGANTGLTGGSVPRPVADGRPTIVVSMKALDTIVPIDQGNRVLCLAGVGLASLHNFLHQHFPHRESHSILGSTFLNPTTAAGVSLGSGGTQLRKGPASTERALYLKVIPDRFGKPTVKIVNTLGIQDLDGEEGEFDAHIRYDGIVRIMDKYIASTVAAQSQSTSRTIHQPPLRMKQSNHTHGTKPASDADYKNRLCQHEDNQVNRYNADLRGEDCNRSEGKVIILASVHDTFLKPSSTKTFWISFDSLDTALQFRRDVCLDNPADLPISMEYMDRDAFDVIDQAGRVLGTIIHAVGTSSPIVKRFWNLKLWMESWNVRGAATIGDHLLYWMNPLMPSILPSKIMAMGRERDHHLAMTVGDFDGSLDRFLNRMATFQENHNNNNNKNPKAILVHECHSPSEMDALTAFRFVAAPAFRTYCVGNGIQGVSVDYALPRNGGDAPPLTVDTPIVVVKRMRYSHFGCNVVHEDVAVAAGVEVDSVKSALKKSVEQTCQGRLPAEHGHGCEYVAPYDTRKRWMQMDPLNVMNPGVGGLPSTYRYKTD